MKAYYNNRPNALEHLGRGEYRYRWNIEQVEVAVEDGIASLWECDEVTIYGTITSDKITQAVITALWPSDYERKIINEYNAAQMGIYEGEDASLKKEQYRAFLIEREKTKLRIKDDCAVLGIHKRI